MRFLMLIVALICLPGLARAQAQPSRAPTPAWVTVLPVSSPDPARQDRPLQTLLVSRQTLYGGDRHDHYSRLVMIAQNPQGLQALGAVTLAWQPDQSELIVHDVRIIRGSTVVDVLDRGQTFTVLRRENNLETATLDGVLTAAMQVEGLLVGDILDVAFTIRQRPGTLPLIAENAIQVEPGATTRRLHVREIWPTARPMRWLGTGPFAQPTTRQTPLGTELVVEREDVVGAEPPALAPARFTLPATLSVSGFADWNAISRLIAPYYERAANLAPAALLRGEIARIAAASDDPGTRAMAALRLVQDQVRYVALVMGDGNYLPASAEQTWSRRYGDCKAKSVLLLALLRGLGIAAEPVLVNVGAANGMNDRLPQMRQFNHVIVRARIGDRSYWLDGARAGDRSLADLVVSPLQWGLPVRAEGAALEAIPFGAPARPLIENRLTHDASNGLLSPTSSTFETIFRGDLAAAMRASMAQQSETILPRMEREFTNATGATDVQISQSYDEETGEFTIRFSGTRDMDWSGSQRSRQIRFQFSNELLNWQPQLPSDKEGRTAPVLLSAPPYVLAIETIILPFNGEGFTLLGENIDQTLAGARLTRNLSLEGGRAVSRTEFQLVASEASVEDIEASADARQELSRNVAGVSGRTNRLTDSDRRALRGRD